MSFRIDRTRSRLAAGADLLESIRRELEDLHELAYNRHAAQNRMRVLGGTPDYALDTHGDPRARQLLHDLDAQILSLLEPMVEISHAALAFLHAGEGPARRRDASADVDPAELELAVAARARRVARGEYTPHRRGPQPKGR